jgi:hypothetical protein
VGLAYPRCLSVSSVDSERPSSAKVVMRGP